VITNEDISLQYKGDLVFGGVDIKGRESLRFFVVWKWVHVEITTIVSS
jgi:hypothetical protein